MARKEADGVNKFVDIIKAILYEIQPIRYSDAIKLCANSYSLLVQFTLLGGDVLRNTVDVVLNVSIMTCSLLLVWGLCCYCIYTYHSFEMLKLYIIVTLFGLIFTNLEVRKAGDISAYSVFNKNQRGILGGLTAEQFENEIRHRPAGGFEGPEGEGDDADGAQDMDDVLIMEDNGYGNAGNMGGVGADGPRRKKKKRR